MEGIIDDRDADVTEAREKRIEGEFSIVSSKDSLLRIILREAIASKQLTGDMANVVANEIVSEISKRNYWSDQP